jgi:4-hydroxybenzoate polyprenyltransferase
MRSELEGRSFAFIRRLKALRSPEVLLMTGFSMIGTMFTGIGPWDAPIDYLGCLGLCVVFVYCIYALNSFADHDEDANSERLRFTTEVSSSGYRALFLIFGIIFGFGAWYVDPSIAICGLIAILLWTTYYLPPLRLKTRVLWGTIIHWLAGIFHFQIGYCFFAPFDVSSLSISTYFGLLLATGHINHEILDYRNDRATGLRTTAVRMGTDKTHWIRSTMSILGLILLTGLFLANFISSIEFGSFALATGTMTIASILLKDQKPMTFQKVTRWSFLLAGMSALMLQTDYLRAMMSL